MMAQPIECKTLLHHHNTGYLPYHWDANIYRGCAHSCPYCFARYSHGYLGYRDPFDFEQKILVKVNAPQVLDRELATPIFPYLTDDQHSLEDRVRTAAECDVDFTVAGVLSLRSSARQRFMLFLKQQFPELYPKYHQLYRGWSAPSGYSRGVHERVRLLQEKYGVSHNIQWPQAAEPRVRQMPLFVTMEYNRMQGNDR